MIAFLPQAQTSGDVPANDQEFGAPVMSSREIAELVESRHDKVKQSIERLASRGVIGLPPLGEYLDSMGRSAKQYMIGKRDSYVIVAQLSPEFTARLVDRWQELEAAKPDALAVLNDPVAMRGLLLQYTERVIAQDKQIAVMKPQVEALHHFAVGPGETHSLCVTDAAKHLKVKPSVLTVWLTSARWAYKRTEDSRLVGFQARIDSGHLTHKYLQYESKTGVTKHAPQVRITQKGIARIALLIQKGTGPGCAV